MNTIYLVLGGGLGNQMFQYAAARAYALRHNSEIKICNFYYSDGINPNRHNSLDNLSLPRNIGIATEEEENAIKYFISKYNKKWWKKVVWKMPPFVKHCIMKKMINDGYYRSIYGTYKFIDINKMHVKVPQELIMQGGFQSIENFKEYDSMICKELTVRAEPTENNIKYLQHIKDCESVCVHIRRGDFLHKEYSHLNVCSEEYYKQAIIYMTEQLDNPVFFIFSNTHEDIEWIRNNYVFPGNCVYIDENNMDFQELQLMCHCKHFIISNSTFSWWAQHLGSYDNKIVCAPMQWDKQYPNESQEIYENNWVIIEA